MGIIYCVMAMNRLSEVKYCVERYLPYVDHVIVLDGGSLDDSIFYFRNWAKYEEKLHFYIKPWNDKFYEQRTAYLRLADKFAKPGDYILVSDPDEWFEDELLKNLPKIIEYMEKGHMGQTANVATFQSRSVSMHGPKRVWENLDDYWKHLFYRWEPEMRYVGNPHETMIIPSGFRQLKTPFIYEHVKQEDVIFHRGARNFVAWGVGKESITAGEKQKWDIWKEFTDLRKEAGIPMMWHDFDKYLMNGNVDQRLKDWMIKYRKVEGFEFASEIGEVYKLFYRVYHPEEEPDELKGESL